MSPNMVEVRAFLAGVAGHAVTPMRIPLTLRTSWMVRPGAASILMTFSKTCSRGRGTRSQGELPSCSSWPMLNSSLRSATGSFRCAPISMARDRAS